MFQFTEPNLAKAGTILILEHMVGMAIGFVLAHLRMGDGGLIFLGIWVTNLSVAWFLYKAALAQGRPRAKWYGMGSAVAPVISLLVFMVLYLHDRLGLVSGPARRSRDEA